MNITWDAFAKAVYIELSKGKSFETKQVSGYEHVFLDYDSGHTLLGIEILNATEPEIKSIGERGAPLTLHA